MTTTLTLPAVLAELDAVARDFGYPVDWAVSIIGARLESKFAEREEDNVLVFEPSKSELREGAQDRS